MSINWPRFQEIIADHERIILTSHIRPDCDALGSELGLAGILTALGKDVRIVNAHETPPNLAFIDPQQRIEVLGHSVQPNDLADRELLGVLDTSAWAQLGEMGDVVKTSSAQKFILDHHVGEDDLGAELFKDPTAEATGRLVLEAAKHFDVRVTPEIAMPLFAAIATDTGWFRFNSTTPVTFQAAAQLVEAGADPAAIFQQLYEQDSLARIKLRGRILAQTESDLGGRLVHTHVLDEDFQSTGALRSDTEDAVNLTLAVAGTEVAVIFVQVGEARFKISFRSRSDFDCSAMARQFDGGGHKAAAGATVEGVFPDVQSKVLDAVRAAMR
ncbi:MAG: DHHA1 domain-containing protein [Pirellulales bacterium]|nr:DHHA1 domain-containing protein [Pirellulales bacterium]